MAAIGVLTLELKIDHAHSLKDKRHVVKSLKEKLRSRFNLAVAEIDFQDVWQHSVIAAVTVSADRARAAYVLEGAEKEAAMLLGAYLVSATIDWLE